MKIIECPRDAMQGISTFIPTERKIAYINQLLKIGFDTLDMGSFVSPKAIPQLADTSNVLDAIDLSSSNTKLLVIVANIRGAREAASYSSISYIGFPLSISETFQRLNTNKSIIQALNELEEMKNLCVQSNKKLVTYLSMGFGNPYGDHYNEDLVLKFVDLVVALGSDVISLADTIGAASVKSVKSLIHAVVHMWPDLEFGAHLHSNPKDSFDKIKAAFSGGARRIDGALMGYGGCPMAKDELVGNIATEEVIRFLKKQPEPLSIDDEELGKALRMALEIFPK